MITHFQNKTAVLTGAGSGFGLECARIGAKLGMNLVLADVQADALERSAPPKCALPVPRYWPCRWTCPKPSRWTRWPRPPANASAPRISCSTTQAWARLGSSGKTPSRTGDWVLGVNLMGVVHGVRAFTPMMLEAAAQDPAWTGHIVNTASMAGMVNMPNMGIYNVSKHAVVSLTETLYQDLALVTDQVSASVLCPFFVPTGIHQSHRNRPEGMAEEKPTRSQMIGQAMSEKAVTSGKVTAQEVAQMVFDAMADNRFYVFSHPQSLSSVQTRMEDVMQIRNPSDPFAYKPSLGADLKKALRAAG